MRRKPKTTREEYPIDHSTPILTVAIVQLQSAFPDGKRVVVTEGRESFQWVSLDDTHARIDKASDILDSCTIIIIT